jgi:hypothetical protein
MSPSDLGIWAKVKGIGAFPPTPVDHARQTFPFIAGASLWLALRDANTRRALTLTAG